MKQIIVNVGGLTIEEKQRVNEALAKITNVSKVGNVTNGMAWFYAPSVYGSQVGWNSTYKMETPTHTPQQVLEMARMVEKGHIHAELMAQYAEDAKTHAEPWKLWQIKTGSLDWIGCKFSPAWDPSCEFRRKPKTHIVHGVEVPDLRIKPKNGQEYWYPDASIEALAWGTVHGYEQSTDSHRLANNLCYEPTADGKQAAILHAKAWLGIA